MDETRRRDYEEGMRLLFGPAWRQTISGIQKHDARIHSPEWEAMSRRAKERAGFRCQVCNSPRRLETHHRTYERLGHERDDDLIVLCHECHGLFSRYGRLTR